MTPSPFSGADDGGVTECEAELAAEYDAFYGPGGEAPMSDVTAICDWLAAESMTVERRERPTPGYRPTG